MQINKEENIYTPIKQCISKRRPEIACNKFKPLDQFTKKSSLCKDCLKIQKKISDDKY